MSRSRLIGFPVLLSSLLLPMASFAQGASAPAATPAASAPAPKPQTNEWLTYGFNSERSNWNHGENVLDKTNVSHLKLLWDSKVSTPPVDTALSTLTAPLVVKDVDVAGAKTDLVILLGADDTLFALNADDGKVVWQKTFTNPLTPHRATTWLCSNTANDTPTIDKARGLVFFVPSDGKLRAVSLSDGSEKMAPTDMLAPFARAWSLNLYDGVIYAGSGRGCGEIVDPHSTMMAAADPKPGAPMSSLPDPAAISAMDVHDLAHPQLTRFYLSGSRAAGPWGAGGVVHTRRGIIFQTADGAYDPAGGAWGASLIELAPKATRVLDSFTYPTWQYINKYDLDPGSGSPLVFPMGDRSVVLSVGKEAVAYLLDTANLGGANHMTALYTSPKLGNEAAIGTEPGQGLWGAPATYQTADGRRMVYIPIWGPPAKSAPAFKNSYGDAPNGSIMAFEVVDQGGKLNMIPQWMSPNMTVPSPPVAANGVVYAVQTGEQTLQYVPVAPGAPRLAPGPGAGANFRATAVTNLVLYAFDAETGKTLYSSKKIIPGWVHFNEPVVALGRVFVVSHDSHVYAFGLPSEAPKK